jgi:hypothetical protein
MIAIALPTKNFENERRASMLAFQKIVFAFIAIALTTTLTYADNHKDKAKTLLKTYFESDDFSKTHANLKLRIVNIRSPWVTDWFDFQAQDQNGRIYKGSAQIVFYAWNDEAAYAVDKYFGKDYLILKDDHGKEIEHWYTVDTNTFN